MMHPTDTRYDERTETDALLPGKTKMAEKKGDPQGVGVDTSMDNYVERNMTSEEKQKDKLGTKKVFVIISILVCELCERLTYYSVVANMVLYCTSVLKYSSLDATTITQVFAGTVYIIPVFGGYLADAVAGRYNTIFGSGLIYLIGLVSLSTSSIDYTSMFGRDDDGYVYDMSLNARRGFFLGGLAFIALGTGGIKANVSPFGAQQIEELGPDVVRSFFNWFYWFVNVGALVAYSGVAYLQQNVSWAWGISVPFFSMIVAILVFVFARGNYRHKPPGESVLATMFGLYRKGCGNFDRVRKSNGGAYADFTVDSALSVLRVLPIFLCMIIYWAIYAQMSSTFFLQAERMDVTLGGLKLPAAILNIFNTIIVLILIPLVDRVIYPFFERMGRPLTHLQRMGIGQVLAGASVVVAGIVEIFRKKVMTDGCFLEQTLGDEKFNASCLSVFVQTPEYALIGASEVFTSITGLEFAFTQAPPSMQGLLTGLFMMTSGLGNFVSTAILQIVGAATKSDPWYPDDINNGKTENLFFLLGGITALNVIIFIFVAKWYKYLDPPSQESESEETPREISSEKSPENGNGGIVNYGLMTSEDSTRL